MNTCATHQRTAPIGTFGDAEYLTRLFLANYAEVPQLVNDTIIAEAGYRDDSCCAAGAFARWLCSAAWRTVLAGE